MTTQAPGRRPGTPARENRMRLDALRRGPRVAADRILLVGTEGVGKTTWAANAPAPIFVAVEDGIRHLDVVSFPEPKNYDDVLDAVRTLATTEHEFKTLVIDTVDWVEPLVWAALCSRNGWASIEAPGFGKGYVAATDEWRKLLMEMDRLRTEKGMEIILLAHAALKTVPNPSGPDYSRYECKLHRGAAALLREWTDANLFAIHEEFVSKQSGDSRAKVKISGRRIAHTERAAGWDAKNRHNLPEILPLDYSEYAAARERGRVNSPERLEAEARDLFAQWAPEGEDKTKAESAIEAAKGDAVKLARIVDRLRSKVAEKEGA